jgi:hypothetical protein
MRIRTVAIGFVLSSLLVSSSAIAQQRHIVDAVAMNRAVAIQTATDQQNRDAVISVLHQPQVQALASKMGLNVTKAEAAIATLSGSELQTLATQANATKAPLAGGDTVIISVTTLLLILIIVLLVAH